MKENMGKTQEMMKVTGGSRKRQWIGAIRWIEKMLRRRQKPDVIRIPAGNGKNMSVFEKMIQDFGKKDGVELLADCMTFQPKITKQVPLRYRLIAVGFVSKMSLEQLNNKLREEGCEQLYARNYLEASLMYAFLNGMSYQEWLQLQNKYADLMEQGIGDAFQGKSVTYRELEAYVKNNSRECGDMLYTQKLTQYMGSQIAQAKGNEEKFRECLIQNRNDFSQVREKARYYFCKYLYFYIESKIEQYIKAKRSGIGIEQAASELLILKSAAKLRKKVLSEQELREILLDSNISFGNLYDLFNYFYFEYVSSDWMEILLEYYGDIRNISGESKKNLAKALRAYEPGWKKLSDDEVIREKYREIELREKELDAVYSLEGSDRGYQKNRSGEHSVRNYIRGVLDIDRTTLICYLLFFGSGLNNCPGQEINEKRLNQILLECGFAALRSKDDFDCFVLEYLKAEDPVDYLMESVTQYALEEKNFFLYHMYRNSLSNDEMVRKIMM